MSTDKLHFVLFVLVGVAALSLGMAGIYRISATGFLGLLAIMGLSVFGGVAFYLGRTHARRRRENRKEPPPVT